MIFSALRKASERATTLMNTLITNTLQIQSATALTVVHGSETIIATIGVCRLSAQRLNHYGSA